VFNLEECMNNEFLRPRENSCKWFNNLGVMRRRLFIEKGDKTKFSYKNNWVNRFKPYKTKHEKGKMRWRMIRVKWKMKRLKRPRKLIDTIHILHESIQTKSEILSIHVKYDTIHNWIDSRLYWYDSWESVSLMNRFTLKMIWFIRGQRATCNYLQTCESIQTKFDTIQPKAKIHN